MCYKNRTIKPTYQQEEGLVKDHQKEIDQSVNVYQNSSFPFLKRDP